jgi:hypothetical protein
VAAENFPAYLKPLLSQTGVSLLQKKSKQAGRVFSAVKKTRDALAENFP